MRAFILFTAMLFISISGFPASGNSFIPSQTGLVKNRASSEFYFFHAHHRFKNTGLFQGYAHYRIKAYLSDGSVADTK